MIVQSPTPLLWRSPDDRVFSGVCGGIGERLGIDPWTVRMGLVLASIPLGAGLAIYVVLYAITESTQRNDEERAHALVHREALRELPNQRTALGYLALCLGVFFLGSSWIGVRYLPFLIPIALLVLGVGVIWAHSSEVERSTADASEVAASATRITNPFSAVVSGRYSRLRIFFGVLMFLLGIVFVVVSVYFTPLGVGTLIGSLQLLLGLAMLVVPIVGIMWRSYSSAQRERMRSDARAEVSAHLHDSVLNTLAIMQRMESAEEIKKLARKHERELRAWMQGKSGKETTHVDAAIAHMAADVEAEYPVVIDVVTVGADRVLTPNLRAMLEALREALLNAARHSGAEHIHVFAECRANAVTLYVRDEGVGFDRESVGDNRQGIRESIEGRMRRIGGTAIIVSSPGVGTEVELHITQDI